MSRASRNLAITTSTISYNIKELERQLSAKFFLTGSRGVVATKEAEQLYKYVAPTMFAFRDAENAVKEFCETSTGTIRIGCPSHFLSFLLMDYINEFHSKYPNVVINITDESMMRHFDLLYNQGLDIVFSVYDGEIPSTYEREELTSLDYTFYATKSFLDKNFLHQEMSFEQFKACPIIFHQQSVRYSKLMKSLDLPNAKTISASSAETAYRMVASDMGIGCTFPKMLENNYRSEDLRPLKIANLSVPSKILSYTCLRDTTDKVLLAFISGLKKFFE